MKRFHAHIAVDDLAASIAFYSKLFGQAPTKHKADYAKWMLDDPRVNFAISTRGQTPGLDHFGIQAEHAGELSALEAQARAASGDALLDPGEAACCYARSEKHWVLDPQGIAWEHFQTMADADVFGAGRSASAVDCCAPQDGAPSDAACCAPGASCG
ncbi:ArsI/CadI family heavy metal resistance metalloenzyme [Denitromonas sp.]|uniref:ArsI/CadI family heavy metal resistance metalloenzyme n=1 Tax=Denitromonas sp. TaxID=2734609 RepID=UPI002AFDF556|nr:ArsI/CadI family heavy metal resistance metalloenzyme [Denitromonas sp.]